MISYVTGILAEVDVDCIVIESGGVGFEILTYSSVIEHLPDVGSEVKIVTYMDVKEDDIQPRPELLPGETPKVDINGNVTLDTEPIPQF